MWTIKRIDEADFGCEERLPGEPAYGAGESGV